MFSQRNNPYCDLLQICKTIIITYIHISKYYIMKTILGLDLGTNSIGWALIKQDFENKEGQILGMGSRIIPMSQDILGDYGKGNSISQTAERTGYRTIRKLKARHILRRERLLRILNILGFLPIHFLNSIDFENKYGQYKVGTEPKIAYNENGFIFLDTFNEMLQEFKIKQPEILENDKLIPYDWTIYYLRKKALNEKIEKEELAWIILHFNQKRGYYQLRDEEDEDILNKNIEYHSLKIIEVEADPIQSGKEERWYSFTLENGWNYRRASKIPLLNWKNTTRDFIVTTELNDDGTIKKDKDGNEKRSFRSPGEQDWSLIKKKTEKDLEQSQKTVGEYIYDSIISNPKQKIKGKLIRTIERKFYKDELRKILNKQKEYHNQFNNSEIYVDCIRELYRNNEAHKNTLNSKDLVHLIIDDIIFYQRPLKSQKYSISNCAFEYRTYKEINGNKKIERLKSIPKSHPLYQEFRIWQWIYNLRIYTKDNNQNITGEIMTSIDNIESLFDFLTDRKEIDQKTLLKHFKLSEKSHYWGYIEDKKYPCNETFTQIKIRINKTNRISADFLNKDIALKLWHLIYSVTDKNEYEKALQTFAKKYKLDNDSFLDNFKKFPPYKSEYGSYSIKAINKLLPIMRLGKYWDWENIDKNTQKRIDNILTGEYDKDIKDLVREKSINLTERNHFQGIQLWLASYIVYGRHSEISSALKWKNVKELEKFIFEFKQHSLRNPIVEQIIIESLRVVKEIWIKFGNGEIDFFDEIHIELGREMKNTSEERKRITSQITENENSNIRIKLLLEEIKYDNTIENVRPHSPSQQEALKIYEEGVINSDIDIPEDIYKISKTAQPTKTELVRYKLWLEQKYRSPYTGQTIPLSKLFTPAFEIEHIIPQSRYFDDSLSNKIICEAAVNKLKDNQLAFEFIKNYHSQTVETGLGHVVKILNVDEYEDFIKNNYTKNRLKRSKLLMDEIPESMINRQLNDTRYISKYISNILSNIVRSNINDDGLNSKNLLPGNGKITSILKQDWGLNEVWNEIILPRFERMNQITNSKRFTSWNEKHQKNLPTIPIELSKGFQKKRIDHRHHALDALIIACTTREHINLLNNNSAKSENRYDLNKKLRNYEKVIYSHPKTGEIIQRNVPKNFINPWSNFTKDVEKNLKSIIVSFKQNLRVINKTKNKYESYKNENGIIRIGKDGKPKKDITNQIKGENWAIRKQMHQDTVASLVKLRMIKTISFINGLNHVENLVDKKLKNEIKKLINSNLDRDKILKTFKEANYIWNNKDYSKVGVYFWDVDEFGAGLNVSSRVSLNDSFNEIKIKSITDTGIQKILLNHLKSEKYQNRLDDKGKLITPEILAFSPEGIDELNTNIIELNQGKYHQPIQKVRTFEPKGNKFAIGNIGNKKDKYVIAAKGSNLFFAIYVNENGKRSYETIPLNIVIERQKLGLYPVPEKNERGNSCLFYLSPNDLVYVLDDDEQKNLSSIDLNQLTVEQKARIYKTVSFTGSECYFIQNSISSLIKSYDSKSKIGELGSLNKLEITLSLDKLIRIKENCIKINVDKLGFLKH